MILVDTNILIDFLKNPTKEKESIFQENEIATCGVIFTELLRGSKNPKESEKLKTALECFEYLSFEKQDWLEVALFLSIVKDGKILYIRCSFYALGIGATPKAYFA